jgi:hypothetical protein
MNHTKKRSLTKMPKLETDRRYQPTDILRLGLPQQNHGYLWSQLQVDDPGDQDQPTERLNPGQSHHPGLLQQNHRQMSF